MTYATFFMCCIRSMEGPRAVRIGSFSAHSSSMRFLYSRSRLSVTRAGVEGCGKKSGGSRRAKTRAVLASLPRGAGGSVNIGILEAVHRKILADPDFRGRKVDAGFVEGFPAKNGK
jgi:hypothetical protein